MQYNVAKCEVTHFGVKNRKERIRGDLIQTYKILTGLDRLDAGRMFSLVGERRTRGHSLRIRSTPFRSEMRRDFFTRGW